ncbi:protein HEAT INTOLERANT 4-like [Rosa rugosa]|uniref:protein HEAT INTOLERANT 4-like n=1 Tax=Rosa rugosa TaxID=74645 RepID=UPI002B4026A6|nr:protein HEAT INTOLERANT 4-like [Rosa rugosa]
MKRKALRELEVEIAAQPLRKRVKPRPAEYLEEPRSLEGLWKPSFPVGTPRSTLKRGKAVQEEQQSLSFWLHGGGIVKREVVALIPVVVAVVSASPPSNELGLVLSEGKVEEIIPMKRLKIDWAPYVLLDKILDKEGPEIFVLSCKQRRAALKHKNVKGSRDLLNANDDELEELDFSGEDEDQVIEEDDEKNVKVEEESKGQNIDLRVREGGRRRSVDNIIKMRIYKLYPVQTPDTPDIRV